MAIGFQGGAESLRRLPEHPALVTRLEGRRGPVLNARRAPGPRNTNMLNSSGKATSAKNERSSISETRSPNEKECFGIPNARDATFASLGGSGENRPEGSMPSRA